MLSSQIIYLLCAHLLTFSIHASLVRHKRMDSSHRRLYHTLRDYHKHDETSPTTDETSPTLRYELDLDTAGIFKLHWDLNAETSKLIFQLEVQTTSIATWLVFGFSGWGETQKADFALFWTDYDGRSHFKDAHTDSKGTLHIDKQQDITLLAAKVTRTHIALKFSRSFDTCDKHDFSIDTGTVHILYKQGHGLQTTMAGINLTQLNPGIQRVQLRKSQLPDPPLPEDVHSFTMKVNQLTIPSVETTYWCSVQKLPLMKKKHHVVKFEGAISDAAMGIIHHIEVFHCEVPPGEKIRDYNAPCKSMAERPKGLEPCRNVIGAWAMGATGLTYPEEAGYPIGDPGVSRYVMLEVHYNNPELKEGVIDTGSGIRFYVTSELRRHDAGIMEIGLEYSDKMALPPQLPSWELAGYCVPQCTQVGLPSGGIRVFASQLHTHATGKRVYTQRFRSGVQLPDLNRDDHYSPHYQEIRKLQTQVHIKPGDSLVTVCEDQTMERNDITLGGFGISDEMCVNYFHYYPKAELEVCKSSVTTSALYRFFNFLHVYADEPTSAELGNSDNYHSIHWSRLNIDLLKQFYQNAPLSMQCNMSSGERFPGVEWEGMTIPEVKLPLTHEKDICDK